MTTRAPADPEAAHTGLSNQEVAARVAAGQVNDVPTRPSPSVGEIVRANVFTRINALIGVLFVLILIVGPIQDSLFGGVTIANSLIGIVPWLQEFFDLRLVGSTVPWAAAGIAAVDAVTLELIERRGSPTSE